MRKKSEGRFLRVCMREWVEPKKKEKEREKLALVSTYPIFFFLRFFFLFLPWSLLPVRRAGCARGRLKHARRLYSS